MEKYLVAAHFEVEEGSFDRFVEEAEKVARASVREDHATYIAHWLTVLKNDTKAIFTAASKASQAADFLADLHTCGTHTEV